MLKIIKKQLLKLLIIFSIFTQITSPCSKCSYFAIKPEKIQNTSIFNNTNNDTINPESEDLKPNENGPKFTTLELILYKDVKYLGDIYVGTPFKKFQVIYDTGSNIFWLASNNCTSLSCEKYENKYNPHNSVTATDLHMRQNITYAVGFVKGRIFNDVVSLNHNPKSLNLYNKEMTVNNCNILCVYSEKYITQTITDGIVGLGINDEGNVKNSLIKLLYEQKQISAPAFSFYLLNNTGNNISKIYIGDIMDNTYIHNLFKNNIKFCHVSENEKLWECKLNNTVEMHNDKKNNSFVFKSNSSVIFDTGTSYTIIPKDDYINIVQHLTIDLKKNCHTNQFEQLICECKNIDEFGDIKLFFDDQNYFEIHLNQLIKFDKKMKYQCRFQVMVDSVGVNKWVIGDSSLRNNLVSFNMEERKISFIQNINQTINENNLAKSNVLIKGLMSKKILWIGFILLIIAIIILVIIFK